MNYRYFHLLFSSFLRYFSIILATLLLCSMSSHISGQSGRSYRSRSKPTTYSTTAAKDRKACSIRVEIPKTIKAGETVEAKTIIESFSERTYSISVVNPIDQFRFSIKNEGREVNKTSYGDALSIRDQNIGTCSIPSRSRFTVRLPLSRLYDLSKPGTYTIQCSATLTDGDGKTQDVESDLTSFEIVEEKSDFTWEVSGGTSASGIGPTTMPTNKKGVREAQSRPS